MTKWFEVHDERFESLVLPNVHVDTLFSEGRWLEGPVYVPAGRYLLFSDIPNNRVLRFDEVNGLVTPFLHAANFTNGHTLDPQGRVLSCEHLSRSVTRVEHDGSVTVIADAFEGKQLNSPNDVVVASNGAVWFTDPTYGIATEYEGGRIESEIGSRNVYRVATDGSIRAVLTDFVQPNGLAFSPDGRTLYVVDSGRKPAALYAFDVGGDNALANRRLLRECDVGIYDGIRLDRHGNIWAGVGDGVQCLSSDGTLLGRIVLPEAAANLCFGGPYRNRIFICATRSLFAVYVNTTPVRARYRDLT
nr:SMP-30/gluconolactonase/LRE family protein [Agrobacterium tumefaciens]